MFQIRLIRKEYEDVKHGNRDDIIAIRRIGEDKFLLSFTYGDKNNKIYVPEKVILNNTATFRWVRTLLSLLELDTDPFANIQIDSPTFPSVLLSVADLKNSYHRILDVVEFYLDNGLIDQERKLVQASAQTPPAQTPSPISYRCTPPPLVNQMDDDDEYDDMPPLVRAPQAVRTHHFFLD
jgi:hypothetical protein